MTATKNGLAFDPGFSPYVLAFRGTVQYLYTDINRFKNLSQKKVKFMQYHKKILRFTQNDTITFCHVERSETSLACITKDSSDFVLRMTVFSSSF